jgi:hypothetical protein
VLYVLEFVGIILIWLGDRVCSRSGSLSAAIDRTAAT